MPEQYRMSRRKFLTLGWLKDIASSPNNPPERQLVDTTVEWTGEGLSFAAILGLAYAGSRDKLVSYTVDAKRVRQAPDFSETQKSVDQLGGVLSGVAPAISTLWQQWTDAFYQSHQEPYTDYDRECDSNNHCVEVPVTRWRTVWDWEEPDEMKRIGFDHNLLEDLNDFGAGFQARASDLAANGPDAFDLRPDASNIEYSEQQQDTGAQNWVAAILYGSLGTIFNNYEEVDEFIASQQHTEPIFKGDFYRKRRTLLKLILAASGFAVVRKWQSTFAQNNKHLLAEIQDNSKQVARELDVTDEQNFQRFFGTTPEEVAGYIQGTQTMANGALNAGYFSDRQYPEIQQQLQIIQSACEGASGKFPIYFDAKNKKPAIPSRVTKITKNLWATRAIAGYAAGRKTGLDLRHVENAGALAMLLAVACVGGELLVYPAMDEVLDKLR